MQLNSHADGQDIFTYIDDKVGTDSTSYPVKAKTRAVNEGNRIIWSWIFSSYGGQQFEDSNQTDLPFATDTLTANKRVYANPTGALALKGVAYLDSSGEYIPLKPITLERIQQMGYTIDSFMSTSGVPEYYMPIGESTYIFPASDTTRASGFKQYIDRGTVAFASNDTTDTPGFASEFHGADVVFGALEYSRAHSMPQTVNLENQWLDYEKRIKKYYSQRYAQLFPPQITKRDWLEQMS